MKHYSLADFHEVAKEHDVLYVEDDEASSLAIYDIGNVELSPFAEKIKQYAYKKGIDKISIKVKEAQSIYFFQHGFQIEATILAYYGLQDAVFLGYYLNNENAGCNTKEQEKILNKVLCENVNEADSGALENITISRDRLANNVESTKKVVYSGRSACKQFSSFEPMKFFAQIGNKVVATASAQFNDEESAVEFSDFTVNVDYNINNLISYLLMDMESYYLSKGCLTAFTIVSANSIAINTVCAENHYEYGGTLKNESMIKGELTSLNTWFKRL
ncbi:hypothetical protein [Colwellia sp. RSH04]|uniref:hypothetical protein n=1 Tax=Colwellia sp. RSH04 TaxID=2305464 RepID=UPI000E598F65|nr:hypothetical protein [Colwellia sp. RSH04]RHW77567.1 hypothetical protein D1094_01040 [Colwellia sp. RSH04]